MCTLIVLDVYVRSAKKSGEETRDLSLFPLKTFRVTKHLMSCARNRVFAFALLSFSLVFYALRFVLFYLFVLSFFVEEVMENEIAWKKRERGMIRAERFKRNNDWVLGVELLRDILYVMMYDFLCKLLPTDDKVFVKITQFDDKNVRE